MAEKYQFLSSGSRNIVGEPFDPYVANQVRTRQQTQFSGYDNSNRSDSTTQILNNQNAWVKLASGVSISGSFGNERLKSLGLSEQDVNGLIDTQLAESAVLFNTLSSINPQQGVSAASGEIIPISMREGIAKSNKLWNSNRSYGLGGTDFGILPTPGIIDVTVTCLNRGSIRKATINLKAYNKFQFAIIEMLYLQLGKHMLLEWGNDKYIDNEGNLQTTGNTLIEDIWFNQNGIAQIEMLDRINIYRAKYSANYDGFFGKVSNFSWDFGNDGTYEISITLITVGDVIESLKVNNQSQLISDEDFRSGEQKINSSAETTLLNDRVKTILGGWLLSAMGEEASKEDEKNPNYFILENPQKEEENNKIVEDYKYFITVSEFLDILEDLCIPIVLSSGQSTGGNKLVEFIKPDCISYSLNQISIDPRVCLIKPKFSKSLKNKISYPHYLDPLFDYATIEGNVIYGNLSNLYLNYDFIFKCLEQNTDKEGNLTLFKFLSNLCSGIENALGNSVNLEPVIRDDRYITIIDQNPIANIEELFPEAKDLSVPLEVYGYNPSEKTSNFLQNITFQTSITPELSTTISIGATAAGSNVSGVEGTAFSKWSVGLKDRFMGKVEFNKKTLVEPQTRVLTLQEEVKKKEEFNLKWYSNDKIINAFAITGKKLFDDGTVPTGWYRREEYIKSAYKQYKRELSEKLDEKALKTELSYNFALYLGHCFGNEQLQFPDSEGKKITIPYRSPSDSNYLKFDSSFISKGKGVYKKYINNLNTSKHESSLEKGKTSEVESSNQIGFIPVNFDLTLNGISGFKIYQKLEINQKFLPTQYPESLEFLVTKVDHIIRDNNWTTGLTTLSIPKVKTEIKDDGEIFPVNAIDDPDLELGTEYITIENDKPLWFRDARSSTIQTFGAGVNQKFMNANFNENCVEAFTKFFNNMSNNPKLKGHVVYIKSTYRSPAEQKTLVEKGYTSTAPGRSLHNYGAAIDIVIAPPRLDYKGNPQYADDRILTQKRFNDPEAQNWLLKNRRKELWKNSGVVQNALDAGLAWAGNWKSADTYQDYVHFYYSEKFTTSRDTMVSRLTELGDGDKTKADGRKVDIT